MVCEPALAVATAAVGTANAALAKRVLETIPLFMRYLRQDMQRLHEQLDPGQMQILGMLSHHEFSVSELAERHKVSPPSMSKTVNSMVERGWVERVPVPSDRRVVHLKLTPEGLRMLTEIQGAMVERVAEVVATLSPEDCERLSGGLDVLYAAFGSPGATGYSHDDPTSAASARTEAQPVGY